MSLNAALEDEGVERIALAAQVYERLLRRIVDGQLPPGQRLNIDHLARDLRVSITPVREALVRLASQHLVQLEPYKGYSVRPAMDARHIAQLFEARLLIEVGAVRAGVPRLEAGQMRRMREDVAQMRALPPDAPLTEFYTVMAKDQAFHHALVAAAGNELISDMYGLLIPLIHLSRLRYTRHGFFAVQNEVADEHAAIIDAYERRDAEEAEECVRRHLLRSRERVEQGVAASMAAEAIGSAG
jgi:DNA-binding GntR family transcriptional regulator